ncbi:MAG TPA: vitamin B12 dependent methionine synthase [Deltaproteobacteria bacterium]|nr:vitamin B12 dependent methionine synthase [Deltaproteobacteria bacterium]
MEIINPIPVELNLNELQEKLHMKPGKQWAQVLQLVESAAPLIEAKVVYKTCYIEEKYTDGVQLDGIRLTSPVLGKKLAESVRVFPYVLTIGPKLEEEEKNFTEYIQQYCLDIIGNVALITARRSFEEQLKKKYKLEKMARLGPGSLKAWPIHEQKPLFSIIGDVESAIGVTLNESFLMIPRKSISGIYFPTEIPFEACQLCPREDCPSRRAPFDARQAAEYEPKDTDH